MKSLHVTPYFMPARCYGGPVESVYQLCLSSARLGCEVRVLTTNANGRERKLAVDTRGTVAIAAGLEARYQRRILRHSVSPGLLLHLVPEILRADLVHLTAVYSFPTIPTLIACSLLRKPLVWSPRGALQRWSGSRRVAAKAIWNLACRILAPSATVLHVTSDQEREESLRRMPGFEAVVIPNGVKIPAEVKRVGGDGRLRLGYLGRLDPKKGIENLLHAARRLKDAGVAFSLTLAGSAGARRYARSLDRLIEQLGLRGEIEMPGEIHGAPKLRFFESIDLLVVPSYTENFAIVVAEALACGVAVVASRGTPWALLQEKGCGLWVDNDPAALAAAIDRLRAADLATMGQRGREWMKAEYSWDRVARSMCNLYASLLHGKPLLADDTVGEAMVAASEQPNRSADKSGHRDLLSDPGSTAHP